MTETKKILNIALPAMAENLLQMLMGVVDSYLVAQVGIVAISGVSVANNIITIYQAIFIALGASSASVIARSLGKGDVKATTEIPGMLSLLLLPLVWFLVYFRFWVEEPF